MSTRRRPSLIAALAGTIVAFILLVALEAALSAAPTSWPRPVASALGADEIASDVTIESIEFEGNERLGRRVLLGGMRQKAPSAWNPFARSSRYIGNDLLAADLGGIVRVYREHGYLLARILEAVVEYNAAGDRVRLTIRIDEGPRVGQGDLELRGVDPRWEEKVRQLWPIRRGEPLIASRLAEGALRIEDFYANQGLLSARAIREVRLERADVAAVVLRVDPGVWVTVDSIAVIGIEQTRRLTVMNELTFREGSLLTGRRLLDSRQRLLALGIFQRVAITPRFIDDERRDRAVVLVNLSERRRNWFGAGFGFSSADEVRALVEWGRINLSGRGRRLGVDGKLFYSIDPQFRGGGLQFREGRVEPKFFTPRVFGRNRGTASGYVHWLQEESFRNRTLGISLATYREISRTMRLLAGLENRQVASTEEGVRPDYTTRLARLEWSNDRRDNPFDATTGHNLLLSTELSGGPLGGDSRFTRHTASVQAYQRVDEGWTLAGRFRVGYIDAFGQGPSESVDSLLVSRVAWGERFRLGGSNSVRGYGEREVGRQNVRDEAVGGLVLLNASAEVRFPVWKLVSGGLFFDLGNVWADPAEIKLSRFSNGLRKRAYDPLNVFYGMGAGLRFATPVGPLRIDVGFKLGSGRREGEGSSELHVALGQAY